SLISLAWRESRSSGNSKGVADGYFYKGCLFQRQMKVDSAIQYLNKANTLYHLINEWGNVPDSYGRLGFLLIKNGNHEDGLKHLLEALKLSEDLKNPQALIRNTVILATHLNDFTGQHDVAINYLKEAEPIAIKLNDGSLLGHIYLQLSNGFSKKEEYNSAIDYSNKSLREFSKVGNTFDQMQALYASANIYKQRKEASKILNVLAQVRPLLKESPDNQMKSTYYELLAEAYFQQDEYKKALSYAEYASSL